MVFPLTNEAAVRPLEPGIKNGNGGGGSSAKFNLLIGANPCNRKWGAWEMGRDGDWEWGWPVEKGAKQITS